MPKAKCVIPLLRLLVRGVPKTPGTIQDIKTALSDQNFIVRSYRYRYHIYQPQELKKIKLVLIRVLLPCRLDFIVLEGAV